MVYLYVLSTQRKKRMFYKLQIANKDYNIDLMSIKQRLSPQHEFSRHRLKEQAPRHKHTQSQRESKGIIKRIISEPSTHMMSSYKRHQFNQTLKSDSRFICGCGFSTTIIKEITDHIVTQHKGRCLIGSTHYLSPLTKNLMPCKKTIQKPLKIENTTAQFFWKGFVFVKNISFSHREYNFYCGLCDIYFRQAVDFIEHCLNKCGELQNCNSSHKIYTEDDWKKQNSSQFDKTINPNIELPYEKCKYEAFKQPQIIEISSKQIDSRVSYESSQNNKVQFDHSLIKFTSDIIRLKIFKIFSQKRGNSAYRRYFYDYQNNNYMVLVNPSKQISSDSFKNIKCSACDKSFTYLYLFKAHILQEKCQQSLQSTFYLLNKRLFLQCYRKRLFKIGFLSINIENFSSKTDPELFYESFNDLDIPNQMRQYFLKNKGFIKLYCGQIWTQLSKPFECKSCKMTSYSPLKLFRHYETKCKSVNSYILIMFKKKGHLNKYKLLSLQSNFLAKQLFYCSCNPSEIISKYQFVNHIIEFHERYIELELFPERF